MSSDGPTPRAGASGAPPTSHDERTRVRVDGRRRVLALRPGARFAARKELATELGCPAELMGDSAKMNVWLHKTVLARIAANGGNVPADLLD